jgi:predicted dehydrogenase
MKIAIISFEHMHAYSYARSFYENPETEVIAAVESQPERLARIKHTLDFIPNLYSDYREMLEKTECDAVVITSANTSHAEIAVECARRGKHILCEKPLATTIDDALAMIQTARQHGVVLMTAFPVRYSPAIQNARELIAAGTAGRIMAGVTTNHGTMPSGWFLEIGKSGGGAVMDHTVHVVDLLRWLLDDEVAEVYAEYGTRLHDIAIDDVGQLLLRFRKGAVISLDTSWSRPKTYPTWGDVLLDLHGEKSNIRINCFPQQMHFFDDSANRHSGFNAGENLDSLMIAEFLSAVAENRAPLTSGEDGLRALEVALAAYAAGREGQVQRLTPATLATV